MYASVRRTERPGAGMKLLVWIDRRHTQKSDPRFRSFASYANSAHTILDSSQSQSTRKAYPGEYESIRYVTLHFIEICAAQLRSITEITPKSARSL